MTNFVPTASAQQRRVIERFGLARDSYAASTSGSHAKSDAKEYVREAPEPAIKEYVKEASKSVAKTSEDVGKACEDAIVPEAPTNPTFLTSYATHVAASIWRHKVMLLRFKNFTY